MSESIVLNLDGKWKLRDFTPGQGLAAGAHLPDYDDTNWHRASVPGDVHMALVEIGRLAPPFYNMNVETCQWVEINERDDGTYEVRVITDTYAYFVKLTVPIESTKFSDNYFDLFPGQERVIEVWNEAGRRLEENDTNRRNYALRLLRR
jgi:hypothetical protein